MLPSLVKSCYFCSAPLREFGSRGDQSFSVPIHYKVSYHFSERSLPKTHSRNLFGREESRRAAASARTEIGRCEQKWYRTYIGLLRGRVFLGGDSQDGNWLDVNL